MLIDRKELLAKLHQVPSLPLVLQELIDSFNNPNLDTVSLAHSIEHDQGLSAKVLRMANSTFYGLPRKVGSIQDAVTVLGFDTVRSLVLSAGVIRIFPPLPGSLFDREAYWHRCYRVATIAKALSNTLVQERHFAFTAGMFCQIGQIVFELCIPQQFSELLQQKSASEFSLEELERTELGFDHFDIGADILHLWNFPPKIEHLVRHWNNINTNDPLACVVHIADSLSDAPAGDALIEKLSQTWCAGMNVTWQQIEANLPAHEHLEIIYPHD